MNYRLLNEVLIEWNESSKGDSGNELLNSDPIKTRLEGIYPLGSDEWLAYAEKTFRLAEYAFTILSQKSLWETNWLRDILDGNLYIFGSIPQMEDHEALSADSFIENMSNIGDWPIFSNNISLNDSVVNKKYKELEVQEDYSKYLRNMYSLWATGYIKPYFLSLVNISLSDLKKRQIQKDGQRYKGYINNYIYWMEEEIFSENGLFTRRLFKVPIPKIKQIKNNIIAGIHLSDIDRTMHIRKFEIIIDKCEPIIMLVIPYAKLGKGNIPGFYKTMTGEWYLQSGTKDDYSIENGQPSYMIIPYIPWTT